MTSESDKGNEPFSNQQDHQDNENAESVLDALPVSERCGDPRCDRGAGCLEIMARKATSHVTGPDEHWSIWPDGGQFSSPPTPDLIADLKARAPARDVIKQQRWGKVRVVPNLKPGSAVVTESRLEYRLYLHLLLDRDVEELGCQPETLELWIDGKLVRYTPDFWVSRRGALFYVEVKPARELARLDVVTKLEAAAVLLQSRGINFAVITDLEILEDVPLRNAELIYRYRQCPLDRSLIEKLRNYLSRGPRRFSLVEIVMGGAKYRPYIMRAILAGYVGFCPRTPLQEASLIWWIGRK